MKKLINTGRKLRKIEVVGIYGLILCVLLISLCGVAIAGLKDSNKKLNSDKEVLNGKISTLQGDLRDIGERLSGKTQQQAEEKQQESGKVAVLKRIGLIATPGETGLSVEVPDGWQLEGENKLRNGASVVVVQSEDIDLLSIPNYQISRVVDSFILADGRSVFLVFIRSSDDNRGYLSLSFCNPDVMAPCSFRGKDGKFVFILAHGFKEGDQFVRDMDFSTAEGIRLLTDFKEMVKSLELS